MSAITKSDIKRAVHIEHTKLRQSTEYAIKRLRSHPERATILAFVSRAILILSETSDVTDHGCWSLRRCVKKRAVDANDDDCLSYEASLFDGVITGRLCQVVEDDETGTLHCISARRVLKAWCAMMAVERLKEMVEMLPSEPEVDAIEAEHADSFLQLCMYGKLKA